MLFHRKALPIYLGLVVYVNALPYLSRLPNGFDWMMQYVPNQGLMALFSILFFGFFATFAAVPLIVCTMLRKHIPITNVLAFVLSTLLLLWFHHDYDLSSDAQAAIGLVVIPIVLAGVTGVVTGLVGTMEFLLRKKTQLHV